jgi:hypothetical protein
LPLDCFAALAMTTCGKVGQERTRPRPRRSDRRPLNAGGA